MDATSDTETQPTQELLAAPASDRCVNCSAPLATDQRYCLNCGERRGKPRFSGTGPAAVAPVATAAATAPAQPPRFSSGTTLIAGVATLLLAMGVGVLIGQDASGNNAKNASAAAPQVITVNGGSAGTSAGTTAGAAAAGASAAHHASSGKVTKASAAKAVKSSQPHLTKKVVSVVNNAASNVVGKNSNLAPATSKPGSKCSSSQAGCQGGKFTGNFFGGG